MLLKSLFVNFKPRFSRAVHIYVDGLTALFPCVKRLGLAFKFGFKLPLGGNVPVIFISKLYAGCPKKTLKLLK